MPVKAIWDIVKMLHVSLTEWDGTLTLIPSFFCLYSRLKGGYTMNGKKPDCISLLHSVSDSLLILLCNILYIDVE